MLVVFAVVTKEWNVEQDSKSCIPGIGFRQDFSRKFRFGFEMCPDSTEGIVAVNHGIVLRQILVRPRKANNSETKQQ